jgi:hypothetical protein
VILVEIRWAANPFRGERFARGWLPAAEAVLDYGATQWGFSRALEGRLDFVQIAVFPTKAHFERYWYSETIAEKRIELAGTYHVPILPSFWEIVGAGVTQDLSPARGAPS